MHAPYVFCTSPSVVVVIMKQKPMAHAPDGLLCKTVTGSKMATQTLMEFRYVWKQRRCGTVRPPDRPGQFATNCGSATHFKVCEKTFAEHRRCTMVRRTVCWLFTVNSAAAVLQTLILRLS